MSDVYDLNQFKEKQLHQKQRKVIELLIYQGKSQAEAAEQVHVTETTVSLWMNRNETFIAAYDDELKRAKAQRNRKYKTIAQKAVRKLDELMDCGDYKVELAAVKEVLTLSGDKEDDRNANTNSSLDRILEAVGGIGNENN